MSQSRTVSRVAEPLPVFRHKLPHVVALNRFQVSNQCTIDCGQAGREDISDRFQQRFWARPLLNHPNQRGLQVTHEMWQRSVEYDWHEASLLDGLQGPGACFFLSRPIMRPPA